MEITYERAKEIREGILMSRRNFKDMCDASYDSQVPKGKLRSLAYARTWVRSVQGRIYFPPKASYTRKNRAMFGPSPEERAAYFEDQLKNIVNESFLREQRQADSKALHYHL